MKTILLLLANAIFLAFPNVNFAQGPDLGTAANFVLFSSVGAVGNTGISQLTGNVGTNNGAITSFGNVNGVMHNADGATAQCLLDLQSAWYQLDTIAPTSTHAPVLGNGDTLHAGVYSLAAAASLNSVLVLDAQGNPNALFIFKIGAAFSTAATSTVVLINGANACNVFWKAEGAISMAALTTMKGTLIAHNGAISTGDGCTLEGRALSTTGSVTVYGTKATIPAGCGTVIHKGPPAPVLRTVECFTLFSSIGAVSNSGITNVTGAVGTNIGSTTGYNPLLVIGTIHLIPDTFTIRAAIDLLNVYNYLDTLPYDIELLYPAQFGNKLILTPHVYRLNAATTFTDTLYLDAEGSADAIFVIQINGALSTSTYSKVSLLNGARAENVYWKVEGAVTINDYSIFCGTIICHNGAISLTTGVTLNGRAFTTTGALTTIATTAANPTNGFCYVLPIELLSFTGACDNHKVVLKWRSSPEIDSVYYSIERSIDGHDWQIAGTVGEADNSTAGMNYSFIDKEADNDVYYRLKKINVDGKYKYLKVILLHSCRKNLTELNIFPNPGKGIVHLLYNQRKDQVYSVSVYNVSGQQVYHSAYYQSAVDLSDKPSGVYFIHFNLSSGMFIGKLVINK